MCCAAKQRENSSRMNVPPLVKTQAGARFGPLRRYGTANVSDALSSPIKLENSRILIYYIMRIIVVMKKGNQLMDQHGEIILYQAEDGLTKYADKDWWQAWRRKKQRKN
jgi:hypothetical protein